MGLFDKSGVVILKETSDAKAYLEKLWQLLTSSWRIISRRCHTVTEYNAFLLR